jgi:hypothetical protein
MQKHWYDRRNLSFLQTNNAKNFLGRDGTEKHFNHPFLQANFMFLGEIACLIVYKLAFWYLKRRQV